MNLRYLAYNLVRTDYSRMWRYLNAAAAYRRRGRVAIARDMIVSCLRHDTLLMDYFHFRYFDEAVDRLTHVTVWEMHRFHTTFNAKAYRQIFRDKRRFRAAFAAYFTYPHRIIRRGDDLEPLVTWIRDNGFQQVVAKEPLGTVGKGVKVLSIHSDGPAMWMDGRPIREGLRRLVDDGFVLFESFITQHETLRELHPRSINTIRVVTFLNDAAEVEIWGALLRMGFGTPVDNFDAGGISALIDTTSGVVVGRGQVKDPFRDASFETHPQTGCRIVGLQIPFWTEVLDLIRTAATVVPQVRTVGWDVAITDRGPTLIEGNDNWDKTHFEIVSGRHLGSRVRALLHR